MYSYILSFKKKNYCFIWYEKQAENKIIVGQIQKRCLHWIMKLTALFCHSNRNSPTFEPKPNIIQTAELAKSLQYLIFDNTLNLSLEIFYFALQLTLFFLCSISIYQIK